jgi:cobyrinic acid a,c-diamide synthase
VTARERRLTPEFLEALVAAIKKRFDLDRLLSLAKSSVSPRVDEGGAAGESKDRAPAVKIGVALDEAFQFYYPANFDLLQAAGAELHFWSPLRDAALPPVDGLYLGGGYPELYAKELSANTAMREAVRAFAGSGRPLYAECGGLMYLSSALEDLDGSEHPMVGLLPTHVRMRPKKLTLGYVEVELARDTPLGEAGTVLRGHEFHYSRIDELPPSVPRAYRLRRRRGGEEQAEGYLLGNVLASYVHLHFGANPRVAERFVSSCREGRRA